jgi:hypothetical protein
MNPLPLGVVPLPGTLPNLLSASHFRYRLDVVALEGPRSGVCLLAYCCFVFNGRNIFRDQLSELLIAPARTRPMPGFVAD